MRPGPIGPGNAETGATQRGSYHCFNEARPNWAGCWTSDCFVRFGSHCSWHRAGPFLTHIRGRTRKPCQPATPISLPRRPFWQRCGGWPGPDHFFPAGASLRPSVSQMLRTNVQNNAGKFADARRRRGVRPACFNEARPNWAGKCRQVHGSVPADAASMRPGPIGPGNIEAETVRDHLFAASMRPGPIGPGNSRGGVRSLRSRQSFNEARPNWAGK